jgi:uncharacterized protein involved in exopolysaccharide biosynthesis
MSLQNQTQLDNTRAKLARLQDRYESLRAEASDDPELRDATLKSLMRYINQFKEEIARYETHQTAKH